jgi:hypothetical protein
MFILSSSRVQRSNIFHKFVLASTLNVSYDHQSQGDFVEDLITFDGYITGIAIRENGSQLAVAVHDDQMADVFLVMRPLSGMSYLLFLFLQPLSLFISSENAPEAPTSNSATC